VTAVATERRRRSGKTTRQRPPKPDPATEYAEAVLAGKHVTNRYVRLACERHQRDKRNAAALGLEWRPWKVDERGRRGAQHAIDFFPDMLTVKQDGVEVPFVLNAWQAFVVGSLFGWYKADGFRRFRTAYVETGKGSGKTPLAAGVGLYMMVADGEIEPEVYSAATTRDQAKRAWKDAWRMVTSSEDLRGLIEHPENAEVQAGALVIPSDGAVFRPVSSEHRGLDGKRVHCALVDELHEHQGPQVVNKMRAGTKSLRNALIFEITNSGHDRTSVCWDHHQLSVQVLEQTAHNEAWFAFVCGLDEGDDWLDESVWPKPNPSLPGIPGLPYLREQVTDARTMPTKENDTKRFNFCVWTEQSERWLPLDLWDACAAPVDLERLKGRRVHVGLDMPSPRDLATAILLFGPDEEGAYDVLLRAWLPEEALQPARGTTQTDRQRALQRWASEDGGSFITLTEGAVCDYDRIEAELLEALEPYELGAVGFNPDELTQMSTHLIDKLGKEKVVRVPQSYASTSEHCKTLEGLLVTAAPREDGAPVSPLLRHGGNPVLRWTAAAVSIEHGPKEQIKVDRQASVEKVAITALVIALHVQSKASAEEPGDDDWSATWV
jgi:phage terminase large subunit-like protein